MSSQHQRKSILIVDDDAQFASSLRKTLRKAGYDISLADNGAEALRLLSTCSFDLAITDNRVGSLTGLEVISSIRRQGIPLRILLLTAFADQELAAQAKKAGADSCLSKPLKREDILECVSRLLAHEPGNDK
jgi:CheY-like chemotaxis protein